MMHLKSLLLAVIMVACWGLGACGVPLQDQPQEFTVPSDAASPAVPTQGGLLATVYLVEGKRLEPVNRATSDTSLPTVLSLLVQGPTDGEAAAGVRSALVVDSLDRATLERGPKVRGRIIEVSVTQNFTSTTGEDQLLATAQLVWTVTQRLSTNRVRVTVDGEPIELPTDDGLTAQPVDRDDYRTVAPGAD